MTYAALRAEVCDRPPPRFVRDWRVAPRPAVRGADVFAVPAVRPDRLAADFFAGDLRVAVVFFAADFRPVDRVLLFFAAVFLPAVFFPADFLPEVFFADDFFAVDFLALDFLALDFFAADRFAPDFFAPVFVAPERRPLLLRIVPVVRVARFDADVFRPLGRCGSASSSPCAPPSCLFTVAHARRSASSSGTP